MGCEAETEAAILVGGGASRTHGAGGKVPGGTMREQGGWLGDAVQRGQQVLGLGCRSDCTYRVAEGSAAAAARHSAKSNGRSQLHRTGVFHPLSGYSTFRVLMLSICALLTIAWASMLLHFISVIG